MIEMQIFGYNSGPRIKLPSTIHASGTSATQVAVKTMCLPALKTTTSLQKKNALTCNVQTNG